MTHNLSLILMWYAGLLPLLLLGAQKLIPVVKVLQAVVIVLTGLPQIVHILLLLLEVVCEIDDLWLAVSAVVDGWIELGNLLEVSADPTVDDLGTEHVTILIW